jgi:hypothetical protein
VFDSLALTDTRLVLCPGGSLVFDTDGVTEARRGADELVVHGLRRLISNTGSGSSAAHLAIFIEAQVSECRDGLPWDDNAVLVVHVAGVGRIERRASQARLLRGALPTAGGADRRKAVIGARRRWRSW